MWSITICFNFAYMLSLACKAFPFPFQTHFLLFPSQNVAHASHPVPLGAASTIFPIPPVGRPTYPEGSRRMFLLGESSLILMPETSSPSVEFLQSFISTSQVADALSCLGPQCWNILRRSPYFSKRLPRGRFLFWLAFAFFTMFDTIGVQWIFVEYGSKPRNKWFSWFQLIFTSAAVTTE